MSTFEDSGPTESLYPKQQRRRMSDHKLDALANSAVLKLVQSFVTVIVLPVAAWVGLTVLERLNTIEKAIQDSRISSATMEIRMATLENRWAELKPSERLIVIETELRELRTRNRP